MVARTIPSVSALAMLAALAGCSSPSPDFYTLAAVPGPAVAAGNRGVELRRIGLAGYLDRSQIVRATTDYRVRVADNERWGEPMGGMLDRVFTEDLVSRLPGASVFAESGAISTQPDLVVEVDVQRFDADADGTVVLLAQVAVRHDTGRSTATARTVRLTAKPLGDSTSALVAAMSQALGQLSDAVAEAVAAR